MRLHRDCTKEFEGGSVVDFNLIWPAVVNHVELVGVGVKSERVWRLGTSNRLHHFIRAEADHHERRILFRRKKQSLALRVEEEVVEVTILEARQGNRLSQCQGLRYLALRVNCKQSNQNEQNRD